jgi:isopenicillin N synthase-like dioxygenase
LIENRVEGWSVSAAGDQWISTVPTQAAMVVEPGVMLAENDVGS